MEHIYYVETSRWNDGKYQQEVATIYGESPVFIEENGPYTGYSLTREPASTDEWWIVGSTRESMLRKGMISEQQSHEESVLVALHPTWEGSEKHTVAVLAPTSNPLAKDEMDQKYCQSRDEAEAYIAEKYPHATHVGWQEIFAEYRARVAKSGISFETRSHLMR